MNTVVRPFSTSATGLTSDDVDAVFTNLPLLFVRFDGEGKCLEATSSPALMAAIDTAALIGRYLDDLVRSDSQAAIDPAQIPNQPVVLLADSREQHMIGVQAHARQNGDDGETLLVLRAETPAEAEQREYSFLPEIARRTSNIIVVTDVDRQIIWTNDAFEKRTGYSLDEARGRRPADLVQFEGTDRETTKRISAALRRCEPVQAEVLNRSKHGEEYWLALDIQPLFCPDGTVWGYLDVQTDITTFKTLTEQAEKAARQAREEAEERLKSTTQLRVAIDALPHGFAIYDSALRLVASNGKFRELVRGAAREIVPGTDYATIIREISESGGFLETKAEQARWSFEKLERLHKSSNTWQYFNAEQGKWIEAVDKRLSNGGLVSLRLDITDLKEAKQRLDIIIEGAGVGTYRYDATTGVNEINDLWAHMIGYAPEELGEITFERLKGMIHPDDLTETHSQWDRVFRSECDELETVFRLRHKDGHWVSVMSRGRINRRDADGQPEVVSGVHIDVTEQKAREEALVKALKEKAEAEQRFLDIANVSDEWFWEHDEDLRYTWHSDNFSHVAGTEPGSMVGKTIKEIYRSDQRTRDAADWDWLEAQIAARRPFRNFNYPIYPEGRDKPIWMRSSGAPLFDADGRFRGYQGIGSDVTALVEARERAEDASQTKSIFLANMSHEIRTPLNGVLGMAELLEDQVEDQKSRRMVSIIRDSGNTLLAILNDLLDMSKIEAGRLELERLPFRPADVAKSVENLHAPKAEEKGLTFEVMTASSAHRHRLGDANRVRQILNNLIGNAIKFTEAGEVETRILARNGSDLVIEVRDTGIGMTKDQAEALFQEFSQVDASITRRFGGTGLGLSIVKKLVDMMGGQIEVKSALGEGTCITVSLPLPECDVPTEAEGSEIAAARNMRLDGVRILAADDNHTNRILLTEILTRNGAEVTQVENGESAVEAWAPGRFEVLILDIAMPVMDGTSALKRINELAQQSSGEEVLAIAFSANAMAHQVVEYIEAGFATHVPKPFHAAELLHAIASILPQRD